MGQTPSRKLRKQGRTYGKLSKVLKEWMNHRNMQK